MEYLWSLVPLRLHLSYGIGPYRFCAGGKVNYTQNYPFLVGQVRSTGLSWIDPLVVRFGKLMRLVEDSKIAFDIGWLAGNQAVRYDNGIAVIVMASDDASWVRKKVRHVERIAIREKNV